MSRRKNRRPQPPTAPVTAAPPAPEPAAPPAAARPVPGLLVGSVVALLAARSVVAGEDPGRLRVATDSSGVLLATAAWLLAVLTAAWWAWRRPPLPRGLAAWSAVALLGVLLAVSAVQSTGYRHAALLGGWEVLLWPVLFGLAWLVASPADDEPDARRAASRTADRLLGALVATALSAAAGGLLPALATRLHLPVADPPPRTLDFLRLGGDDVLAPRFDPEASARVDPAGFLHFTRPDTLAGWLVLALPAAFVAAALSARAVGTRAVLLTLAVALALSLPSGVTWLAVPIAAFAVWDTTRRWGRPGTAVTTGGLAGAGLAVVAGVGLALLLGGPAVTAFWASGLSGPHRAAAKAWQDRPWLGVGPEQFSSLSRKYLAGEPAAPTGDAACLPLDLLVAGGSLALAAALLAAVVYLWTVWRSPVPAEEAAPRGPEPLPWAFYAGGAAGLLLGFVLRSFDRVGVEEPRVFAAAVAVVSLRSLVWFAGFAVLEAVRWGPVLRRQVLLAGVLAVLIFGMDSSAPMLPALAWPFWLAAGLALAGLPLPAGRGPSPNDTFRWVVPAGVAVLLFAQVGLVAAPEAALASAERTLRENGPFLRGLNAEIDAAPLEQKPKKREDARKAALGRLIGPQNQAAEEWASRPGDLWARPVGPQVVRAHALAFIADLDLANTARRADLDTALKFAEQAAAVDPVGTDALRTELLLRAKEVRDSPGLAVSYRRRARELLDEIRARDPSAEARTRYAWAAAARRRDPETALDAARAILADPRNDPVRRLSEAQLADLQEWAAGPAKKP